MGKRSDFERMERDFYPTPYEAVVPLVPHLPKTIFTYVEPCAGDGALINHLLKATDGRAYCIAASDITPQNKNVLIKNVFSYDGLTTPCLSDSMFITNPPWDRKVLHPIIAHLSNIRPTWLLFDADWMHTKQSSTLIKSCVKIVSVGRVKWIPDSKMTGKDNCAWYLFDSKFKGNTEFFGR